MCERERCRECEGEGFYLCERERENKGERGSKLEEDSVEGKGKR